MSLDEKLEASQVYTIGPRFTKVNEDTFILKVVKKIYRTYKIKEKLNLEEDLPIIVVDLPSKVLNKNSVYLSRVFLDNGNKNMEYSYLINVNLTDILWVDHNYLKDSYTLKIYKNGSIAYVDSDFSVRDRDYIIAHVNAFSERKLPRNTLSNVYESLFSLGVSVKYL